MEPRTVQRRKERLPCAWCERRPRSGNRAWCSWCYEQRKWIVRRSGYTYEIKVDRLKDKARNIRLETLEAYGGRCFCCGEDRVQFLCLDHKRGGGSKHRREVGNIYLWAKRNGYPDILQVACSNCNSALGLYGWCPHNPEHVRPVLRRGGSRRSKTERQDVTVEVTCE